MADVSVEFGATDTGLQKTLETIQQQMTSLQGEVNSGTLSFQEINQKMRELRQAEGIFTKLGGEVSEAAKSVKEFENQIRLAEAVTKSNRTALEIYSEEIDKLGKLLDSGLISQKTYAAAIEKAEAALKAATPQTEEARLANEALEASLKQAEAETRALAEEQRKAEAITKSNRTATEIYNQEIEALQNHLNAGRISMDTFERAVAKADAQLAAANPQVEELGKDIKGAGEKSEKMGDQAGIGFGKLASAVGVGQLAAQAFTAALDAAFSAVKGTIDGFRDALNLGGTLSDLSASTGETAGNLLLLQRAFDNTGAGADAVGPALARLQNSIFGAGEDSKAVASAFGRMGISMEEMAGKTPTEQLALVASGISGIEDPAARAATAIDIFGKSGVQLLPLLTNFSSEMNDARATVGSMAEIMDRRAAVFDAVSDRFTIISQKVRDFAAGILDRALPAIDAITSALSRIDAAAIGQKLADSFLGGESAMKGFQAAVDAISIGKIDLAFKAFYESLKLQAMQTAESIYKHLVAGFQTAGDFIQTIFAPGGATMTYIEGAFNLLGMKAASAIAESFASALPDNALFGSLKQSMQDFAATTKEESAMLWGAMYHDVGSLKTQLESAGAALPKSFQENYDKIPPLFANMTEQQKAVAAAEAQIAEQVKITTANREKQSAQTEAELATRQFLKEQQAAADAQAKADKVELITLETQINEAKAAGNTELAKSLEKELETKKAKEEIAKLTKEYVKNLGVSEEEAGKLATNFVNAKNAAAGVHVDKTSIRNAKAEAAEAAKAAQSFATWLDYINGVDPTEPVKSLKERTKEARKEIEAFGNYIGVDLKNLSYPDIIKKLKIDSIATTGSGQLEEIMDHIEQKRQELIGINPIDESGSKQSVNNLKEDVNQKLKEKITIPAEVKVDEAQVSNAIAGMQAEIKNSFTGGEGGVGGDGGAGGIGGAGGNGGDANANVGSITEILNGWTEIISAIRDRLPMQALA